MILDYIESALGEGTPHHTSKGLQYNYKCPFCDDHKQRLFINVDRGVYWCHHCEAKGTLVSFISDYTKIPWAEALKIYREYESYEKPLPASLEEEVYQRLIKAPEVEIKKYIFPLPEEFTLIENATGKAGKRAVQYIQSRGVSLDMAERYYLGYCESGDYANRIILPDFENGELIYWQARTWEPTPKNPAIRKLFKKVLNPSLTREQVENGVKAIGKSEVISNIDFVLENGMCVLCEGRFDALTLRDIGACLHGKVMSDTQYVKLVRNKDKIHTIAVMMDGDAFANTLRIAKRLYKHFDNVLVCKLPKDKDPSELGTKGCIEILNQALEYSPMFEVKARLKGWI